MDITKYPYAKEYASEENPDEKIVAIRLEYKDGYSLMVLDGSGVCTDMKEFESLGELERNWNELPQEEFVVLDGAEPVSAFRAWQANGYYTASRQEVEHLVDYANKLGDYATKLERENTTLLREALGMEDIPPRPVYASLADQDTDGSENVREV